MSYPPPSPEYVGPPKFHGGNDNKPINRIVLHGTVSPCEPGGARDIGGYFKFRVTTPSSCHYIIDPGEDLQLTWDSVVAYHDGHNTHELGIEMCDPVGDDKGALPLKRWDDKDHTAMMKRTARLVAQACLAYNIPPKMRGPVGLRLGRRGVCEHSDISKAFKTSTHWDLGNFPRRRFIRMVRAEIADLKGQPRKAHKHKKRTTTRVDMARDLLGAALRRRRISKLRAKRIKAGLDALPKH